MNLVDMKLEKKAREKMAALPSPSIDEYPWGCRITLDGDAMKKLGLKPADFKAGQRVKVEAVGKVVEIASRQTVGSNTDGNRMEVQLREIGVEADDGPEMAAEFKGDLD